MNEKEMQEEIERLTNLVNDLENERQDLIYKASPIKIGSSVKSPIDNKNWTVIDIEYELGRFRYLIEDVNGENLQMLSEKNLRLDPLDGRILNMKINEDLVSVKKKD